MLAYNTYKYYFPSNRKSSVIIVFLKYLLVIASIYDENSFSSTSMNIKDVFAGNLNAVMDEISLLIEQYPIIGVDTEFPGTFSDQSFLTAVSNKLPLSQLMTSYQVFKTNVDNLKPIQLGLALINDQGKSPDYVAYQFNFNFDIVKDLFVDESIQLLFQHNIDFDKFRREGINPIYFSYLLIQSGLLCNPKLTWVFFHGNYDLGYMIKLITLHDLPLSQSEFIVLYKQMFINIVDLKITMKWESSLQNLMQQYNIDRFGEMHQAGSDAYGTVLVYVRCGRKFLDGRGKIHQMDE